MGQIRTFSQQLSLWLCSTIPQVASPAWVSAGCRRTQKTSSATRRESSISALDILFFRLLLSFSHFRLSLKVSRTTLPPLSV